MRSNVVRWLLAGCTVCWMSVPARADSALETWVITGGLAAYSGAF
jgi:hypothetical protein